MYVLVLAEIALVGELLATVWAGEGLQPHVQGHHVGLQLGGGGEASVTHLTRPAPRAGVGMVHLHVSTEAFPVTEHFTAHMAVGTVGGPELAGFSWQTCT